MNKEKQTFEKGDKVLCINGLIDGLTTGRFYDIKAVWDNEIVSVLNTYGMIEPYNTCRFLNLKDIEIDWSEKDLIKEIERLKTKIKNKTAYTKSLEKKAYSLSLFNEFLENRIAITEPQTRFLTPIEQKAVAITGNVIDDCFKQLKQGFDIKKEEKKEVQLIRGKWYCLDSISFIRFKQINKDRVEAFTFIGFGLSKLNDTHADEACFIKEYKEANYEQVKQGIEYERENGKFWSDEKKDFLKLEDVCYKAESRQELLEIANTAGVEILANDFDIDITYPFVQMGDSSSMYNSLFVRNNTEVTKETFIKLLKNYKG